MLLEAETTALNDLLIYCYLWSCSTVEKCGSGPWITYKQSNLPLAAVSRLTFNFISVSQ